ncbi:MAG: motility associated factor glycosyltransferase family protein [Rhodospirillales bacterium]
MAGERGSVSGFEPIVGAGSMNTAEMPSHALFERNHAWFSEHHATTWQRLEGIGTPVTTIVRDDGEAVNIDLGGGVLYPDPAPEWSKNQLDGFRRFPDRIAFSDPSHCNLSEISLKLLTDLGRYARQHDLSANMQGLPVVDVGYLFVFGVGLGYHIPDLVAETSARHIVLIEPVAEFLLHSLSVIDWGDAFATANERGIALHFVLERDPEAIASHVEMIVSREGNTFLDGSFFCAHYYSWQLKQTYVLLKERLKNHYISTGFFEDEIEMVRNCVLNLQRWPFRLVQSRPHREQSLPVFILGAGPSIDDDMPHIRKLRDRVIVFSCGTALGILLKNGIRPDFHVEVERGELTYTLLSGVHDEHGFEGITLIASTTVDPRVSELFPARWFFFRHGLSPTTLLKAEGEPLLGADPLVCNAAFSAAAFLGFSQIYLFGIDLAQKLTGRHHSKDSIYFTDEHADLDEMYVKRFDREVPGNFGGTVETFWAFDLGRQMLSQMQRICRTNLVNCSDGAKIYGAKPRVAASVTLPDILPRRQDVRARLEAQLPGYGAGEMLAKVDLDRHIRGCEEFVPTFERFLATIGGDVDSFFDMEVRLCALVGERRTEFDGFFSLALSSMVSMLRIGSFFANRITDADKRRAFFEYFLDRYRERCVEMAQISRELLTSIDLDRTVLDGGAGSPPSISAATFTN